MSYFSVISCPSCGQKVTLTPEQIIEKDNQYEFLCRRCRHKGVLDADFFFKHPTKKDLPIGQAISLAKSGPGLFGKIGSWFKGS